MCALQQCALCTTRFRYVVYADTCEINFDLYTTKRQMGWLSTLDDGTYHTVPFMNSRLRTFLSCSCFFLLRSDNDTYSRSISTFLGAFTLSLFVAHIQYFSLLARVAIDSILPTYLHQLTQLNDEINHKCKNKKHEKKTEKNAIMNYKRHHNCDSRVVLFWISIFLDVQRNN